MKLGNVIVKNVDNNSWQAVIPCHGWLYTDIGEKHKAEIVGYFGDMKIDVTGLEPQLDELKNRWHHYTRQRWLVLESHRNFIFSNEHTLKQIRWWHFLSACEAIKAYCTKVVEIEQQELVSAEGWLWKNYEDIMDNSDPDMIKLRKKRKVVFAPGAFDGMLGKDEGDGSTD